MTKRFLHGMAVICIVFSAIGMGCKKEEPKGQAPLPKTAVKVGPVGGYQVISGTLEKGGLGFVLSSEKDKAGVAFKRVEPPFKNSVTVKGKMKAAVPSGVRNGFITFTGYFPDKKVRSSKAGILIGQKVYTIDGALVGKVEKPANFDQAKVFDLELTVSLKEKTVKFTVDGQSLKTKISEMPLSLTHIGLANSGTKTEFSELQISGD